MANNNIAAGCKMFIVEDSIPPVRRSSGDAGMDIFIQDTKTLQPGETHYFRAGIRFELTEFMQVDVITRSRTFKEGVVVVPTVVDATYTNEISTIVTNTSHKPIKIERGMRLAQCILRPWFKFENEEIVASMQDSMRKESDKFGSSGR